MISTQVVKVSHENDNVLGTAPKLEQTLVDCFHSGNASVTPSTRRFFLG